MFTVGQISLYSYSPAGGPVKRMKVWDGGAWVAGTMKVWNGSAWIPGLPKVWNGSAWI